MTRPTLFLNGKYLHQGLTGVQRVAGNLIQALDDELSATDSSQRWVLLHPRQSQVPLLRSIEARPLGPAWLHGHAWEQCLLPSAAHGGLLISFAGSAPWFARRQFAMLHDAAVFDHPEAYTPNFVRWYRALFRHLSAHAEGVLTPSSFSAERLRHWLASPRLTVLPASGDHMLAVAANTAVIERLGLQERPFFLAVASANPTKNLALLRQAFSQWPGRRDTALVLVGGGNSRVFRHVAIPTHVDTIETGSLADAELKALYQRARALVFPSIYEGFGIPPLEAMHCGCPVIAARVASLPEVCGAAAHYVDPYEPSSLIGALDRLARDEVYRQQLRDAGNERAQQFSWRASARQLLKLLGQNAASEQLHLP